MYSIVLVLHYILCIFLIIVVLLQQGKGADAGATFGGNSQSFFGASGANTLLGRITTVSAILFMVTSLLLVKHYPQAVLAGAPTSGNLLQGSVLDKPKEATTTGTVQPQAAAPERAAKSEQPVAAQNAAPVSVPQPEQKKEESKK